MLSNKDYNWRDGFVFKDLSAVGIKAVRKPHTLKRINYNKVGEDLFATPISDNKDEDNYIQK